MQSYITKLEPLLDNTNFLGLSVIVANVYWYHLIGKGSHDKHVNTFDGKEVEICVNKLK